MIVYMRFPDGSRKAYELGARIGGGAEGDVYLLAEDATLCVKVYKEPRDGLRGHIEALTSIDSRGWHQRDEKHLEVAWPFGIAEDEPGLAVGFFMNTLRGPYLLAQDLFSVQKRAQRPFLNWGYSVGVAADLAWMVGKLHDAGMLVCDLALENLAFSPSGRVEFLDSDSFQFSGGSRTYGGSHWRADNGAPEGGPGRHTRETDYFSLAVVICQLLLERQSPFAGIDTLAPSDDDREPKANIVRGRSWLFHPEIRTPRGCPPPWVLPGRLRDLARLAFETGASAPSARPTSAQWYRALVGVAANLRHCGRSVQHVYDGSDTLTCPWCDQMTQLDGRDPFPSPYVAAVAPMWLYAVARVSAGTQPSWPWRDPAPAAPTPAAPTPAAPAPVVAAPAHDLRSQQPGGQVPDDKQIWASLKEVYDSDGTVTGTVVKVAKNGLTVDIGHTAFLPETLIESKPAGDLEQYVGRTVAARIIHMNDGLIVLSQLKVLGAGQAQAPRTVYVTKPSRTDDPWEEFTQTHQIGQFVRGKVKKIMPYGAFVQLGSVDGLLHVSNMSVRPVTDPAEMVKVGQEIRVKIVDIDTERKRVSLSLKDAS